MGITFIILVGTTSNHFIYHSSQKYNSLIIIENSLNILEPEIRVGENSFLWECIQIEEYYVVALDTNLQI